ncbi:MAG: phosphoglycerate kinase [Mollicutes bacterium]|jgi:phosphoglycerate kinase|nr:phosphoglycerate kinase [Mollicutes bacterium]
MEKNIHSLDLNNKKVIVRCDFNVTIKEGKILDDTKIVKTLKTLNYLLDKNCSVIMLSHFGKIKDEESKSKNSLKPISEYLSKLLNKEITFVSNTRSEELTEKCRNLQPGQLLMIENTRFEDVPNKLESNNDEELSKYWASLGEVFINDAFGSSHRAHASVCGIAKHLPAVNGFIVEEEVESLSKLIINPERPFTVVMGGAKVDDKIDLIKSLIPKCDYLITGGGIANTFLLAKGYDIGKSLANKELVEEVKTLLEQYPNKIILPLDVVVGKEDSDYIMSKELNNIESDELIYDIGNKTIDRIKDIVNISKTIFVNGTVGLYENELFANGTKEVLESIATAEATTIAAGGDSVSAVNHFNLDDKFDFLSTGGGASLEFIIDGDLPGIIK